MRRVLCLAVALGESQFRMGVLGGGALLALVLLRLRFCGDVGLPVKPPPPANVPTGSSAQLMGRTEGTETVYMDHVARDAAAAGVATPSLEDLSRELVYRAAGDRIVLAPGDAPVTVAGLQLSAAKVDDAIALTITNTTSIAVAYRVMTVVTPASPRCAQVEPIAHDAVVLAKGATVTRAECGYTADAAIGVTSVETIELPPLEAYYLDHVPAVALGIEPRIARAHVGYVTHDRCAPVVGQALKTMVETGKISWRDLADFYARHRCQTYQFRLSYRAVTVQSPRSIPAVRDGQ